MFLDIVYQAGVEVNIEKSTKEEDYTMMTGACHGISLSDFGRNNTSLFFLHQAPSPKYKKISEIVVFLFLGVSADLVINFSKSIWSNPTDFVASIAMETPITNVGVSASVVFNETGHRTGHSFSLGIGASFPGTGIPIGDVSFAVCKSGEVVEMLNHFGCDVINVDQAFG